MISVKYYFDESGCISGRFLLTVYSIVADRVNKVHEFFFFASWINSKGT